MNFGKETAACVKGSERWSAARAAAIAWSAANPKEAALVVAILQAEMATRHLAREVADAVCAESIRIAVGEMLASVIDCVKPDAVGVVADYLGVPPNSGVYARDRFYALAQDPSADPAALLGMMLLAVAQIASEAVTRDLFNKQHGFVPIGQEKP